MTLNQIADLIITLDSKVEEGLDKLKETPIDSQTYNIILNNIITSTTLANKIRIDNSPFKTEKGDA
jgi:hypothetical protein